MPPEWVIDVEKDLEDGRLDGGKGGSVGMPPIFRVPENVRRRNEEAYKPEVVSVGPYHHGEERLQAMEEHKRRALLHFLRRSKPQTPAGCLDLLRDNLQEIMAAYDNLDGKWRNDQELFLKMMLMDGCFIIEILLAYSGSTVKDYDKDDPIFGHRGQLYMNVPSIGRHLLNMNVSSIRRDLLLIENQIPLLVLRKLFSEGDGDGDGAVVKLLLKFLRGCEVDIHGNDGGFGGDYLEQQGLHILDLYRRSFIYGDEDGEDVLARVKISDYNLMGYDAKIPSAMALRDLGIFLRRHPKPVISFDSEELDLPALTVDDATESAFLNAMVFESLQRPAAIDRFTSYVSLMCDLIVSPEDANLLSTELGIIRNELRSDQALVELFVKLSSSAYFVPDELRKRINDYCGRLWIRWRARVIRPSLIIDPWTILREYREFVLLVIGVAQIILAQRAFSK